MNKYDDIHHSTREMLGKYLYGPSYGRTAAGTHIVGVIWALKCALVMGI